MCVCVCVCVCVCDQVCVNAHLGSQGLSSDSYVSGFGAGVVITELGQQGP